MEKENTKDIKSKLAHRNTVYVGNLTCSGNVVTGTDGVTEVGQYLDFHPKGANAGDEDYCCRLQDTTLTPRFVDLPAEEGTLALTNQIPTYVLDKQNEHLKMVSLIGDEFDGDHWYPVSFKIDTQSVVGPCDVIIWNCLSFFLRKILCHLGQNMRMGLCYMST